MKRYENDVGADEKRNKLFKLIISVKKKDIRLKEKLIEEYKYNPNCYKNINNIINLKKKYESKMPLYKNFNDIINFGPEHECYKEAEIIKNFINSYEPKIKNLLTDYIIPNNKSKKNEKIKKNNNKDKSQIIKIIDLNNKGYFLVLSEKCCNKNNKSNKSINKIIKIKK